MSHTRSKPYAKYAVSVELRYVTTIVNEQANGLYVERSRDCFHDDVRSWLGVGW
jgi:hypothetical protein